MIEATGQSDPYMAPSIEEAIDRAEHDALSRQCPTVFELVGAMVAAGKSTQIIRTFFSRVPRMYPALLRRIEATAAHARRRRARPAATSRGEDR